MEPEEYERNLTIFKEKASIFSFFRKCLIIEEVSDSETANHYTARRRTFAVCHAKCRTCHLTFNMNQSSHIDLYLHLHSEHEHDFARCMILLDVGENLPLCKCPSRNSTMPNCKYSDIPFNDEEVSALHFVSIVFADERVVPSRQLMRTLQKLSQKRNSSLFNDPKLLEMLMAKIRTKLNCFPIVKQRLSGNFETWPII